MLDPDGVLYPAGENGPAPTHLRPEPPPAPPARGYVCEWCHDTGKVLDRLEETWVAGALLPILKACPACEWRNSQ